MSRKFLQQSEAEIVHRNDYDPRRFRVAEIEIWHYFLPGSGCFAGYRQELGMTVGRDYGLRRYEKVRHR